MDLPVFSLTDLLAVYASVLSTVGLAISIALAANELKKGRPRLRLRMNFASITGYGNRSSEALVSIEVANTGSTAVVLTSAGWITNKKMKIVQLNYYRVKFPYTVDPGRAFSIFIPARGFKTIEDRDQIISFFVQSEIGQSWICRLTNKFKRQILAAHSDGWKILWNPQLSVFVDEPVVPEHERDRFV